MVTTTSEQTPTLKTLKINEEIQKLLPPLTETEYRGLEADILEHGCLSPLVMWDDTIVDGHNRYAICRDHELPFETVELDFESLDDAKFWAWSHQEHRRNLTPYQRTELALKFKPQIEKQARERQRGGQGGILLKRNSAEATKECNTRDEIARRAGVSKDTVSRVEYLDKHADNETKERLRKGVTTINREYTRLRVAGKDEVPDFDPEPITPTFPNPTDTFQESVTLEHILLHDTETLIACLFSLFDAEYREQLITDLLAKIEEEDGSNTVERIVTKICNQFPMIIRLRKDREYTRLQDAGQDEISDFVHVGPEYLEQTMLPSMDYLYQSKGKDAMAAYLISLIQRYELGQEIKKAEF